MNPVPRASSGSQVHTSEDVQLAVDHGLDSAVISNHGSKQLDGVPATLDALRECGSVARGKCIGRIALWGPAVSLTIRTRHGFSH